MNVFLAQAADPLLEWLSRAGAIGVLAFMVIAFLRGWIAPGGEVLRLRDERDRALDLVYKQAEIAQRALSVTEKR